MCQYLLGFFCSSSFLPLSGGIWNDALLQTRLKGTTLRWANGSASVEPYYVLVLWRTEREVGWCWTNSHRRASAAWGELAVHKKKAQLKRAERDVEQKQTYSEWKVRFQTLITNILGCAIDLCELKIPDSWVISNDFTSYRLCSNTVCQCDKHGATPSLGFPAVNSPKHALVKSRAVLAPSVPVLLRPPH